MRYGDVALFCEPGSVEEITMWGDVAKRYITHPEMHYTFMVVRAHEADLWVGGIILDPGNSYLRRGTPVRCTRALCDLLEAR